MALLGNPQDVLTTPYGYSGQMAPETAIAEQALNRRRLLANMLTQQGLQPAQGRMAGRFYVAPSPLQGGAGLAQVLAGALGNRMIDSQQDDLMQKDRQMVESARREYQKALLPTYTEKEIPIQATRAEMPDTQDVNELTGGPTVGMRSSEPPPKPQTPLPMGGRPGETRQHYPTPIEPTSSIQDTMGSSVEMPKIPVRERAGSEPTTQTTMITEATQPSAQRKADALAALMTHQHPQVRAYGQFLAQQMQKEQEREIAERHRQEDMGFKMLEHNTPSGNAKMMSEATQATAKEANAARIQEMTLRHNDEQKKLDELARHHGSVEKYNADKLKLDAQQARERNTIDKEIAGMRADLKQVLTPVQAQKMKGDHANAYQALSSTVEKGDLALKKIDSILDPNKASSFNNLYGGYNAYATQLMPGQTQDIKNEIDSLKANLKTLGFDLIRQSGSIGQMTEKEWPIVADQIAKLDNPKIGEPEARSVLESVKNFIVNHRNKAREIYDMEWADSPHYKPTQAPSAPAGGPALDALPQGAKQIGTSGGKPVYQLPDGRKVIGE